MYVLAEEKQQNRLQQQAVEELLNKLDKEYKYLYELIVESEYNFTTFDYDYVMWYLNFTKEYGSPQFGQDVYESWLKSVKETLERIQNLWNKLVELQGDIFSDSYIAEKINATLNTSKEITRNFFKKIIEKGTSGLSKEDISFLSMLESQYDLNNTIDKFVESSEKIRDHFKGKVKDAIIEQLFAEFMYEYSKDAFGEEDARNMAQQCSELITARSAEPLNVAASAEGCVQTTLKSIEKSIGNTNNMKESMNYISENKGVGFIAEPVETTYHFIEFVEKSNILDTRSLISEWKVTVKDSNRKAIMRIDEDSNGKLIGHINYLEKNITIPLEITESPSKVILKHHLTLEYLTAFATNTPKEVLKELAKKDITSQYEIVSLDSTKNIMEVSFREGSWTYNDKTNRLMSWNHGSSNHSNPTVFELVTNKLQKRENISPTKVWKAKFSDKLDPNTIDSITVYVVNENGEKLKNIVVSLEEDEQTISIGIDGSYEKGTYYLMLSTQVKSLKGERLNYPVELPFTVVN